MNSALSKKISLTVEWVPRRFIRTADALSKLPDHDDWETTFYFFNELSALWGPFDIDRFADQDNAKVGRFNSKFHCPGTEHVNAFTTSWGKLNNYIVPPVSSVPRVLRHMEASGSHGILIVPY